MLFSQHFPLADIQQLTQVFQASEYFELHIHREKDKFNNCLQKEAENHSETQTGIARRTTWPVLSTYERPRQNYKANFVQP